MTNKKTYRLALGGICLALTILFMFGASIAPGVELTLYAISSLFVAVMILESGVKGGVTLYIAAVLLGLLIVPNKVGVLPYVGLFGLYGIVKFFIEKQMCIRDRYLSAPETFFQDTVTLSARAFKRIFGAAGTGFALTFAE